MLENLQKTVEDDTGYVWAEVGADPWERHQRHRFMSHRNVHRGIRGTGALSDQGQDAPWWISVSLWPQALKDNYLGSPSPRPVYPPPLYVQPVETVGRQHRPSNLAPSQGCHVGRMIPLDPPKMGDQRRDYGEPALVTLNLHRKI